MPDPELLTLATLADVTIRPAVPADARAWAVFLAESQGHTYRGLVPDSFGADRLAEAEAYAEALAEQFAAGDDIVRVVAEHAGRLVGVAAAGPGPLPWEVELGVADVPAAWQLQRLYLHHDWHGTGLADRLLAEVLDDRAVYLWLIDGNARAQRFYQRRGFVDLAESIPAGESWGSVPMHRMVRSAPATALPD